MACKANACKAKACTKQVWYKLCCLYHEGIVVQLQVYVTEEVHSFFLLNEGA